jgi:hypothetical protein
MNDKRSLTIEEKEVYSRERKLLSVRTERGRKDVFEGNVFVNVAERSLFNNGGGRR